VDDVERSTVRAVRVHDGSGPALLASVSAAGTAACHLCVLPGKSDGRDLLLTANYGDGSVAGFELDLDSVETLGRQVLRYALGAKVGFIDQDAGRQEGPHAHAVVVLGENIILVPNLGSNCVWRLSRSAGIWAPATEVAFAAHPGAGPRHAVVHPTLRFVFAINELSATVAALGVGHDGVLTRLHEDLPLHPELSAQPASCAAALRLHPNGRWLYALL